jgi:hypothetical protein
MLWDLRERERLGLHLRDLLRVLRERDRGVRERLGLRLLDLI